MRMRYANASTWVKGETLISIQTYIGLSATIRAIAGTVRGRRQTNSTIRFKPGRRRRTQTMVGRSRTSIATGVITASSRDTMMPLTRPGVWPIRVQPSSVRGALIALPRVENSNIATSGARKKTPTTTNTTQRKIVSFRRRDRCISSPQPFGSAPLQHRVQGRHDHDDHDHGQGQGLCKARLCLLGLAGEQVLDLQGDVNPSLGEQRGRRGVG